ncbi:hypothetical protein DSO57_1030475 [Entomophthora muscae]|uniref:Uncharacterized protein n=1 Tax=Entomophthora muscae TaxID=34485 RepID=A0ACC2TMM7_9FUNG|nr:hypothetical protein DSO57_1030475 [Entomophthora muscae]
MLPTLRILADTLVSEKLSVRFGALDIGDLIVFTSPRDPYVVACKRIIGMPGDTICTNPLSPPEERSYMKIPPGHVWVQGDNASNSTDSRIYGPLPLGLVKSKVLYRAYPNFKSLRNNFKMLESRESQLTSYNPDDVIREVTLEYLRGELPEE